MKLPKTVFLLVLLAAKPVQAISPAEVQTLINNAPAGGTVTLPSGTFSWNSGVKIEKYVKVQGAGAGETTLRNDTGTSDWNACLISVIPQSAGSIEISGIGFVKGNTVGKHMIVAGRAGQPPLVHDCYFEQTGHGARSIEWQANGGVVWNCEFVSADKSDNSGIAFKNPGSDSAWKAGSTLGNLDTDGTKNTYVEDCTFRDVFLQAFDFDDNCRAVIRHCVFDNSGGSSHGQDTSPVGMRQFEFYNNRCLFSVGGGCNPNPYPLNMNYWFYVRGGTGVIFANEFPKISSCAWGSKPSVTLTVYNITRRSAYIPCQTSYPALRQVGFGSDASGRQISDPVYLWDNTGTGGSDVGITTYSPDECGNGQQASNYIKLNRDYYMGQSKPNYTPYTYPHPLRAPGGGGGKPSPTPSPTATPAPSPSPTASPNPTPTPGNDTYRNWLDELSRWIREHPAVPDK